MDKINDEPGLIDAAQDPAPRKRRFWRRLGLIAMIAVAVLLVVAEIVLHRAEPILKGRVVQALSDKFNSRVELDDLQVSIVKGLEVSGSGLRIFPPDDVVAAGANFPLIAVRQFEFHAGITGLFIKPMHVGVVHVDGLTIHIPPRGQRQPTQKNAGQQHKYKVKILVDEFVCDNSQLVIGTDKPNKDPKLFALKRIVLHDVGPNTPWPYDATLTNAIPRGDIRAVGSFGPWNTESPGDSSVNGKYTFEHVDLNTIKGIGGRLSSVGNFQGRLNRIRAQGTADVPNFSLDTANHPVPLHTKFTVIVDGLTGDTYLQPVQAVLGQSAFSCKGEVVNIKGKGHIIDLDVDIPQGRIQDFLELAVKTDPVLMTGVLETKTSLHIPPGKESISQKLTLLGDFRLADVHFTKSAIQMKVNELSMRAQGHPDQANANAQPVEGEINGRFKLLNGELTFEDLHYLIPGAGVRLEGVYSLDGRKFDFYGHARTEAHLSQMVSSPWKSLLLKAVDPFFAKNGAGVEVPIKVTGTNGEPKFGLAFGHKDNTVDAH